LSSLAGLRRVVDRVFASIDLLLLPTAGTIFQTAAIAAEPVRLNADLGLYTNFANRLDLAAIAVPAGFTSAGLPFGVSLMAAAFADRALLGLAARCQAASGLPRGAVAAERWWSNFDGSQPTDSVAPAKAVADGAIDPSRQRR
jgi:allophanate hydrolase